MSLNALRYRYRLLATTMVAVLGAYVLGHVYPRPLYYALYCVPDALNPMVVKRRRDPAFIGEDDDEVAAIELIIQAKNQAYYDWLHDKMHE